MKITKVFTYEYHIMEIEDGPWGEDWTSYRRNGGESWEVLMGGSWEPCYSNEEELEEAFQEQFNNVTDGEE